MHSPTMSSVVGAAASKSAPRCERVIRQSGLTGAGADDRITETDVDRTAGKCCRNRRRVRQRHERDIEARALEESAGQRVHRFAERVGGNDPNTQRCGLSARCLRSDRSGGHRAPRPRLTKVRRVVIMPGEPSRRREPGLRSREMHGNSAYREKWLLAHLVASWRLCLMVCCALAFIAALHATASAADCDAARRTGFNRLRNGSRSAERRANSSVANAAKRRAGKRS